MTPPLQGGIAGGTFTEYQEFMGNVLHYAAKVLRFLS